MTFANPGVWGTDARDVSVFGFKLVLMSLFLIGWQRAEHNWKQVTSVILA
jgi:hypothetical protein